jgi:hypothetical protein
MIGHSLPVVTTSISEGRKYVRERIIVCVWRFEENLRDQILEGLLNARLMIISNSAVCALIDAVSELPRRSS